MSAAPTDVTQPEVSKTVQAEGDRSLVEHGLPLEHSEASGKPHVQPPALQGMPAFSPTHNLQRSTGQHTQAIGAPLVHCSVTYAP